MRGTFEVTFFSILFLIIFGPIVITSILVAKLCIEFSFIHSLFPLLHLMAEVFLLWTFKKTDHNNFGAVGLVYSIPLIALAISIPFILVSGLISWLYYAGIYTVSIFHLIMKSILFLVGLFFVIPFAKDFLFRLIKIYFSRSKNHSKETTKFYFDQYFVELPKKYTASKDKNIHHSTQFIIDDLEIDELSNNTTKDAFLKSTEPYKILQNKKENLRNSILETELSTYEKKQMRNTSSMLIRGFYQNKDFTLGIKNHGLLFFNHEDPKKMLNRYHDKIKGFIENYDISPAEFEIIDKKIIHLKKGYFPTESLPYKTSSIAYSLYNKKTRDYGSIFINSDLKNTFFKKVLTIKLNRIYFPWKACFFAFFKKKNKMNHVTNIVYFKNNFKKIGSIIGYELVASSTFPNRNKGLIFQWFGYDHHTKKNIVIVINYSSTKNLKKKLFNWNKIIHSFKQIEVT